MSQDHVKLFPSSIPHTPYCTIIALMKALVFTSSIPHTALYYLIMKIAVIRFSLRMHAAQRWKWSNGKVLIGVQDPRLCPCLLAAGPTALVPAATIMILWFSSSRLATTDRVPIRPASKIIYTCIYY